MKNYAIALFGVITLVLAVFAPSFVDNASSKNMSIAKTQTDQETALQPKAPSPATDAKPDSFTAGNSLGEKKAGDTMEAMVERGKKYLLTQVNNRLKQLGAFRDRVENTAALNDSDRKSLVSELDGQISLFETFKSDINKSATKQNIKNVADKIKAEWIKSRVTVAHAQEQMLSAKENQLISDADTYSLGIQKRIEALKASGKGTKDHEKLLSAYGKKIAVAKQNVESAKAKASALASASTDAEKAQLIKEREVFIKNAHDSLREAYKLLKESAKNIRS